MMFFKFLSIALLTVLWWAAIWLALPVDWLQGSLLSLAGLHAGSPALLVAAWWAGKRAWGWQKARVEKRVKAAETANSEAQFADGKATHEAKLNHRRAYLQCRAVWAEFTQIPEWATAWANQCVLLEQIPKTIEGIGRKAALSASLERVFEAAFQQNHATAWLPVILVGQDKSQLGLVEQAWCSVLAQCGNDHPSQFTGSLLQSDPGALFDHLLAQFEADPTLPAVIVIGMDSPLADAAPLPQTGTKGLGHAVVAVLLSRPNLADPGEAEAEAQPDDETDDDPNMQPYWERERGKALNAHLTQWERIPPPLRQGFWSLFPLAALHRPVTADVQGLNRNSTKAQRVQNAILDALINADLRDLPFQGQAPDAPAGSDEAPKTETAKPPKTKEAEAPELFGGLVHNCGSNKIPVLATAIRDIGSEIDVISDGCHLTEEHGDVGMAESVLALAEALILAMQRQTPVLTALCNEKDSFNIGFTCPIAEGGSADAERAS